MMNKVPTWALVLGLGLAAMASIHGVNGIPSKPRYSETLPSDPLHKLHTGLHSIPLELRCKVPFASRIVKENCKPGSPSSEWDVNGAGDPSIQGYSTDISYNIGETAEFKINTDATSYRVDIYRLGYYQGLGARKIATVDPMVELPQKQPDCTRDATTMMYDCREWAVSAQWKIPVDTISGVFIARLTRTDGKTPKSWRADNSQAEDDPRFAMPGGASMQRPQPQPHAYGANGHGRLRNPLKEAQASLIYFVVRNDSSTSDIVFQTADTVWQAYNAEGGTSMYGSYDPAKPMARLLKASLNRPLNTRRTRSVNSYLGSEYPISRFLEANGYDVTYVAGVDTDRQGTAMLLKHKLFLSTGHDEYWSGPQRKNIEEARGKGLHLAFLSGNEMFWRIRWEDDYRVMVCYKESQSPVKIDPKSDEWTGTFRDARAINPLGSQPENAVTGQIFTLNAWRNDPLIVPYVYSRMRQWRHTGVAKLQPGERAVIHRGILGHEMDEDVDNGFRPPHLIHLSETEVDNVMFVQDHGSTYDSGSGTHHLTLYKDATSGAIVFGAGTVQWGWALDGFHDSEHGIPAHLINHLNTRVGTDVVAPNRDIQQFTVNLFGDMGVFPNALNPNLVPPHGSSLAVTQPKCRIQNVNRESDFLRPDTKVVHVTVEAAESLKGQGVIAGVEVRLVLEQNQGGSQVYRTRWIAATRTAPTDETGFTWLGSINLVTTDPTFHKEQENLKQFLSEVKENPIKISVECIATDDSLNTQAYPTSHVIDVVHSLKALGAPTGSIEAKQDEL